MFIHSEKLNPCRCGSKVKPDLDSDDMVPTWQVQCFSCGQSQHNDGWNWTMEGAIAKWNKENPLTVCHCGKSSDIQFNPCCSQECWNKMFTD